jgi:dTDP-4-dehydrorhamnose reductase
LTDPVILITGSRGLLGPYLVEAATARGQVVACGRQNGDHACDLSLTSAVEALIENVAPDVVLHAAGFTDVDGCESDSERAERDNHRAAANLAAALPADCRYVFVSTDQVYPDTAGPHREGGEAPVNAYGRSKLAGEQAALAHPNALAVRTNIFGPSRTPGRTSLSDFVSHKLTSGEPVMLFRDVLFSPLHMASLAGLIFEMIDKGLHGAFNLGSRDGMSKSDFGLAVAAHLDLDTENVSVGESTSLSARAPRTLDLRLDVERVERALGQVMPALKEEIAKL